MSIDECGLGSEGAGVHTSATSIGKRQEIKIERRQGLGLAERKEHVLRIYGNAHTYRAHITGTEREGAWAHVPTYGDVLITRGPPAAHGYVTMTRQEQQEGWMESGGIPRGYLNGSKRIHAQNPGAAECVGLLSVLRRVRPAVCVFGSGYDGIAGPGENRSVSSGLGAIERLRWTPAQGAYERIVLRDATCCNCSDEELNVQGGGWSDVWVLVRACLWAALWGGGKRMTQDKPEEEYLKNRETVLVNATSTVIGENGGVALRKAVVIDV